ncbi:OPT oligopeptide transporter protein-domain-containing protein [Kockovaella imperatae]|uniref:OPT oligopeptide transporter protein-domain-containing protein n=1 Tax=Kockovaella imperatae TaxID=4999 RepID=A0A1Y1URJ4_9TREE|nr:OPT oligopeptide transporter protein-domain-containing protein [Kockovaella imperatae]ORX40104.1 OPT oligopeptide transporter protein-domain-containing protein [Kockovaella imperatae]
MTEGDVADMETKLSCMELPYAYGIASELFKMHKNDQNFPQEALNILEDFVTNYETIVADPAPHTRLIREAKMECLLATENSPYLEVRANTETTDDPMLPCLTFRVWIIGTVFAAAGSFIDTLFAFRQPPVYVGVSVGQLLAYPAGKFLEKITPQAQFHLFGYNFSLNPGPFSRKEHMLITLMCNVSMTSPYTVDIVPVQYLPQFFNQSFAKSRGYQFLNTIGTNFVGYGMAGLTRRFLVWPSFAIWPGTLSNLALIKAFHTEKNEPVRGPFGVWRISRERFFLIAFGAMAIYFFFPGFIWTSLSAFSWITWIAPNNIKLDAICGFNGGMGFNPWPTWDYNITYSATGYVPLAIPLFTVGNLAISTIIGCLIVIAIWFPNKWNTAYLPINAPDTFDNTGGLYNVSKVLNDHASLDLAAYQDYSEPWMSAGTIVAYIFYFVMYSATIVYICLFHRHELGRAFQGFWRAVRKPFRKGAEEDEALDEDIHCRLMRQNYVDVPEWVYAIVLLVFAAIGMIGVGIYPTQTSPVVLVFGIVVTLITLIPVGVIQAVTGIPVPTNVIAEFVGGAFVSGNANALMYYKTYGYISCYQAMAFSNDLKLAHYSKLPPWHTFTGQMWATMVYSIVSASIFNFAMSFRDVCTKDAAFNFTCPGQEQYFTAAVFWGTLSPKRLFGKGKRYNLMLLGFPAGVILVLVYWALRKKYPRWALLRQVHPVIFCQGPIYYLAPYNVSYMLPFLYVTLFSFKYIRPRYTEFWAKYNYVLASAFPTGIAVSAVIIFFALEIPKGGLSIDWWGNTVNNAGCEGEYGCLLLKVPESGYFGATPGTNSFT